MADFCMQCAKERLGIDNWSDFEGICGSGSTCFVLCEGCGVTEVNCNGVCQGTCQYPSHVFDQNNPSHLYKGGGAEL